MMKIKYVCTALIFLLFSCSEEKKAIRKNDVFEIKELGELSTVEYMYSKVLKVNDSGEWYKLGDRRILISCKAKVKAGIDFSVMNEKDFEKDDNEITIYLPAVRITSFDMDPSSIKTEMKDINGLRSDFTQEDKNEILRKGEKSIRADLSKTSIYRDAAKNAVSFVEEFYEQLGYKTVNVKFRSNDEK